MTVVNSISSHIFHKALSLCLLRMILRPKSSLPILFSFFPFKISFLILTLDYEDSMPFDNKRMPPSWWWVTFRPQLDLPHHHESCARGLLISFDLGEPLRICQFEGMCKNVTSLTSSFEFLPTFSHTQVFFFQCLTKKGSSQVVFAFANRDNV